MVPPEHANAAPSSGGVAVATEIECDSRIAYTEARLPLQDIFNELPLPTGKTLQWLLDQGVPFDTLYMAKGALVRFNGITFDFDTQGVPVVVFRCEDCGETIDLAAWSARDHRLATWRHAAFALGDVEQCFNPATWFDGGGLRIHADPLEWLQAGCNGIVVLEPRACWAHLRHVPRVICADIETGDFVKRWNKPPQHKTEILIAVDIEQGLREWKS